MCTTKTFSISIPWFNLLNEKGMTGIRESEGSKGEPFNLRQAEIIIGQGVTNAIMTALWMSSRPWNISMRE